MALDVIKLNCLLPDDERTVAGEQNLLLVVGMFLLLLLQHLNLLEALEGESDFIFELNQLHTSEAAHAERPNARQFPQLDVTELARCRGLRGPRERLIYDSRVADHLQTAEVGVEGAVTTQVGRLSGRATLLN